MASISSKLLKHFGIKKNPPHPPKPDYGAQKSASEQELLPRSPTRDPARDRSTLSLVAPASQHSDFDTASLSDSPHHYHRTLPSGSGDKEHSRSSIFGTRPKDSSKSTSPKVKCNTLPGDSSCLSGFSINDNLENDDRGAPNGHEETQDAGSHPQLLDEYSDPYDLKRQIAEAPELLGECASAPVTDDDYSVPYDVKKFANGKLEMRIPDGEGSPSPRKGAPRPEDGATRYSPSRSQYLVETSDIQSASHSGSNQSIQNMFRQQQADKSVNQNKTPLMTPKRTSAPAGNTGTGGATGSVVEGATEGQHSAGEVVVVAATGGLDQIVPADGAEAKAPPDDEEDEEGYTHLKEELGTDQPASEPPGAAAAAAAAPAAVVPPPTAQPDVRPKDRTGNYDEPWDLTHTRLELEEKLIAVSKSKDILEQTKPSPGGKGPAPPHESDTRPQEGYEKPWDWKPDKRDDRTQEGYEKPWDWKPHQRDDRPPEEYEEPWDQKAKDIEIDLIHAKSAKEAVLAGKEGLPSANGILGPGLGSKSEDSRPGDEYDEPWDQRMKKMALTRTGSDSSNKSSPSPVLPGHSRAPQGQSPKKGKDGGVWQPMIGERINPVLPLDEQGWYHGSISRQSAESLLRVHKEGSYLVRLSESNKLDYSLSLKSARGFMHMKITSRDSRYILGQFSQPFDSIPMMINHYSISKLPIKGQEHMFLLHPIIHELL